MLSKTGEMGYFKIVKREGVQDGIERITYKAGSVAVKYMQGRERLLRDSASVISVGEADLQKNVERFFNEWKEQKKKIEKMTETIAKDEAKVMVEESRKEGKPVIRIIDVEPDTLKKIGIVISESEGGMAVLMNNQGNVVCAAGKGAKITAKELMERVKNKLGGSGGGSPVLASGKVMKVEPIENI